MTHEHEHHQAESGVPKQKLALIGFLIVAGFFLFTEHRAHLFGFLPFLLLLACPLLHLLHEGHGDHEAGSGNDEQDKKERS